MDNVITPRRLLAIALLGCIVAALFGAAPLAAWVDGSIARGTVIDQAAQDWLAIAQHFGFDRPYNAVRRAVRDAEALRFAPEVN
jgi:hypothetical protein